MDEVRNVFMTGATGVMGMAALKEFFSSPFSYNVTVLARDSKKNRKKLSSFESKGLNVIWGDLLDKEKLSEGIKNADIVLHVGGMVSPEADLKPELTLKINLESIKSITEIIKEIENTTPDRTIALVYIGSVSQYGSHLPPYHWGGVGMKLSAAKQDAYAYSKIMAERTVVEAGLKKWVSLRQTAILHPGLLKKTDNPVMFHVPLNGALEWVTDEDSGRLLERVSRNNVPDDFWNNFYNVGGGKDYRLTNIEFERKLLKALRCPSPEKIFETNWFALDNFHGIWFKDSDRLNDILKFRKGTGFDAYMESMRRRLPFYFKLAPLAPSFVIKKFMKKVVQKEPLGPLSWIKKNEIDKIKVFWGSLENYRNIPKWEHLSYPALKRESEGSEEINQVCKEKDLKLDYKTCHKGHKYLSSEFMEKTGGHSCPYCLKESTELKFLN